MHPQITVYTKGYCPHCKTTKALLKAKGVPFVNHDLELDPTRRPEMIVKSAGHTTVPQIFIGDFHVGGNSDLNALNASGHLDALLAIKQPA